MSKNDVDAVRHEFESWKSDRASGLPPNINLFEVFCSESLLKDHNLSDEEILSGIVGRGNDGGCDGFYFLVGGKCLRDDTLIPKQHGLTCHLVLIQSKEGDGFSPLQIDQFHGLLVDLLDTHRPESQYCRTYNDSLLRWIRLFKQVIQQLHAPRLVLDCYYVTMLDVRENEDCLTSAGTIEAITRKHFSRADVHDFHFVNASRLYSILFERAKFEKKLKCVEVIDGTEGYIILVRLIDLFAFLKSDDGELAERIFDDNVRGFQMDTRVNESILKSLVNESKLSPEFWLLNNGITVLSPEVESIGGKVFRIVDPQIVNGLQTSRQIFDYFKAAELSGADLTRDQRRIVVRLIQSNDETVRESIIRATNNQNPMPAESLYTTTRIHHQLELLFQQHGLYYERRKGYWRDKRTPISKIISSISLVQSVIAIMKRDPSYARGRPRDYINEDAKRHSIFGHDDWDDSVDMPPEVYRHPPYDFGVYLKCWQIVRSVDRFLDYPELKLSGEDKRNLLYPLSLWVSCSEVNNAHCPPNLVKAIDIEKLKPETLKMCFTSVRRIYRRFGEDDEAGKSPKMTEAIRKSLERKFSPRKNARRKS